MLTTPDPHQRDTILRCPHTLFHAHVNVEEDTRKVFINVTCRQCGQAMIFPGQGDRAILQGEFP